jgi:hypothetical protein
MNSFVYEGALDHCSGDKLLVRLREMVADLRKCHPELKCCSLADLSLRKQPSRVTVTLYFKENP